MRALSAAVVLMLVGCGGPSVTPSSSASATATPTPAPEAISRDEAVDVARSELAAMADGWVVTRATLGSLDQVLPEWQQTEWGRDLGGDLQVWYVVMASGSLSGAVVIGGADGSVYGSMVGIAN